MPFFFNIIKNQILDCVSLQVHKPIKFLYCKLKNIILYANKMFKRKRVYEFTSSGGLTIEASIVITIFLSVVIFILSYIVMINTQLSMIININNVAKASAKNAYYMEIGDEAGSLNKTYEQIKSKINNKLNENQKDETLKGNYEKGISIAYLMGQLALETKKLDDKNLVLGNMGIDGSGSSINNGKIDLVISYRQKYFFNTKYNSITQRAFVKDWTGVDVSKESTIVYIAKNGTVFHRSKHCKYLNIHPNKVTYSQISILHNSSGGKYKACQYCRKATIAKTEPIYITKDGRRYHTTLDCSRLTRSIIAVDISQIGNKKSCSSCGGE